MRADPTARRRLVALLLVAALTLSACGGVQIFDSFGEAASEATSETSLGLYCTTVATTTCVPDWS
ncbi:MAG TPA: hypothetical protein VK891_06960, partial [Euzebyales bacterium]|nr:hypothetical protein [Euzebyales bacterium]